MKQNEPKGQSHELHERAPMIFIGTYTGGAGDGIYVCRLDPVSGELREKRLAGRCENPSYLAIDARRNRLYAVNELTSFAGEASGAVSAFTIDPAAGTLAPGNQVSSRGGAPCYLALDRRGRHLLVANYVGGTVAVLPIDDEGLLGPATGVVTHTGRSINPKRQTAPHPHSVIFDPSGSFVLAPDLGLDRIVHYRFDRSGGLLSPGEEAWTAVKPGAGPRHLVFHPTGRFAFVVNELDSTVGAFTWDPARGALAPIQTISTLPDDYAGPSIAADLHLTPNGKFLYASNRGHDSIAGFAVNGETGRLSRAACTPTRGKTPRGFTIDPSGRFLLAANQDTHEIVVFAIDQEDGTLSPTGHTLDVPDPVCLKTFIPQPS